MVARALSMMQGNTNKMKAKPVVHIESSPPLSPRSQQRLDELKEQQMARRAADIGGPNGPYMSYQNKKSDIRRREAIDRRILEDAMRGIYLDLPDGVMYGGGSGKKKFKTRKLRRGYRQKTKNRKIKKRKTKRKY